MGKPTKTKPLVAQHRNSLTEQVMHDTIKFTHMSSPVNPPSYSKSESAACLPTISSSPTCAWPIKVTQITITLFSHMIACVIGRNNKVEKPVHLAHQMIIIRLIENKQHYFRYIRDHKNTPILHVQQVVASYIAIYDHFHVTSPF